MARSYLARSITMKHSLKRLYQLINPRFQKLIPEYSIDLVPRYSQARPHARINDILNAQRANYLELLHKIPSYTELYAIEKSIGESKETDEPMWNNGFLPGLDIVMLYTILRENNSKRYIEVGSGNSTKVARKAIKDGKLQTKITSVDPFPRASIDHLADNVIRQKLEDYKDIHAIGKELEAGDIIFIDNSHRALPNSDVTVFFLDILPELKKGVIVQVHDIYLPYDYPQFMCDRFYSEQYMLAAFLLANPKRYKVIAPNYYISEDKELSSAISDIWKQPSLQGVEQHGGSFWFVINE